MTENTIVTTPETVADPKVKKVASKKPAAKKPAPKVTKKPAATAERKKQPGYKEIKERSAKASGTAGSGLVGRQARILAVLAKAKAPMTRAMISDKSGVELSWTGVWLGRTDPAARAASEGEWGYTSLQSLKFVTQTTMVIDDATQFVYAITPAGRKELEAYTAAEAAKERLKRDAEKAKAARAKERAKKADSK